MFENGTSCSVFNSSFASQNSLSKALLHLRVQNVKQAVLCAAFHLRQTSRGGIYRIV